MAKKASIQYSQVASLCQAMVSSGDNPSIRKLHERLGGSFGTLSELLSRWRCEQQLAKQATTEISEELRQSLLAELAKAAQQTQAAMADELSHRDQQIMELQQLVAEQEKTIAAQTTEIMTATTNHREQQFAAEKTVAVAESRAITAEQREKQLHQALNAAREKCQAAEVALAIYRAKAGEQPAHPKKPPKKNNNARKKQST